MMVKQESDRYKVDIAGLTLTLTLTLSKSRIAIKSISQVGGFHNNVFRTSLCHPSNPHPSVTWRSTRGFEIEG